MAKRDEEYNVHQANIIISALFPFLGWGLFLFNRNDKPKEAMHYFWASLIIPVLLLVFQIDL